MGKAMFVIKLERWKFAEKESSFENILGKCLGNPKGSSIFAVPKGTK